MGIYTGGLGAIQGVYVWNTLAQGVYLGGQKVWPVKKVYAEAFSYSNGTGGWGPNFTMLLNPSRGALWDGKAGVHNVNSSTRVGGIFVHSDLGTNSHYCDIALGAQIGGTFTNSHQDFIIQLRKSKLDDGRHVEFRLSPDHKMSIWAGGSQRASETGRNYGAGTILRFATREDGWNGVYNLISDPDQRNPLIQWTDSSRILPYDPNHRALGMEQHAVYQALILYSTYSADVVWYGDL